MDIIINCIYFLQGGYCKNKKVKKSFFDFFGLKTCKKVNNKECSFCIHTARPLGPGYTLENEDKKITEILKDLVHAVDALNLKYTGTKENNAINALQRAKSYLKE